MNTKVAVETITPEKATVMLATMPYSYQRAVSRKHVEFLAEEMRRDAFKQDTTLELSSVNGSWCVTDGQHRLNAIVSSQKPQSFVVVRRSSTSEQDIAVDYSRTDKGRRRTTYDDYKVLSIETELGLTYTQVNKLGSAVNMIFNNFKTARSPMHTDDRLRLMREYNDAYSEFLELTAGCERSMRKVVDRSATLSVALVTMRYSVKTYSQKVVDFWYGAVWDDGLRVGDARKVANRHLIGTSMIGGAATSKYATTAAYSARYLASCFNAFVEDKHRTMAKVMDATKSITILGSPFDGKD